MRVVEVYGDSMLPKLKPGQLVLAKKIDNKTIDRGKLALINYHEKLLIKRIIGLPTETVELNNGLISINGVETSEPYLVYPRNTDEYIVWELKDDEFVMLGDNSKNSLDSRKLGPIKKNNILGQIIFKLWPMGRIK